MKISVLGCGWLGLPLAKCLVELGNTVKGSTTSPDKLASLQAADIQPFLLNVMPPIVGENINDFFDTDLLIVNIPPGRRQPNVGLFYPLKIKSILTEATKSGVSKLIFISSTSVYGNENALVNEDTIVNPLRESGKALVQIEQMLMQDELLSCTVLRMAGLTGPDRPLSRFLQGKKDLKNGNAPVNLVHLEDCIGVIQKVIDLGKWGNIYNVCADEHPLKKDLYPLKAKAVGLEPPTFLQEDNASFKIVDNAKVKRELSYDFLFKNPMDW